MLAPSQHVTKYYHQNRNLPCRFSLLVWNVHKENSNYSFKQKFTTLLQTYPSDILLLQEIKFSKNSKLLFQDYSFALAPNIETKKDFYGVVTATQSSFETFTPKLSHTKELGFLFHKSFLISQHRLCNNTLLYLVNIHAINFVSDKSFTNELQRIANYLENLPSPIIIAGDFNNWTKKRLQALEKFQETLGVKKLNIQEANNIKAIFSYKIDHIYYKGLNVVSSTAIDTQKISDHNPLHALFEVQK